jgi:DNA polymerase I-like protein with 3'-5' exonuclease and polymerase domains
MSSNDPNLQNIPIRTEDGRRIRKAFRHGPEYTELLTADYSQIEMRIMAHLSATPASSRRSTPAKTCTASSAHGCSPSSRPT